MKTGRGWLLGLGGLILIVAVASVVLLAVSAGLDAEASAFYDDFDYSQPVQIDPEEDAYFSGLLILSNSLGAVARELLLVACCAVFVLLAVLAGRREPARVG